MEERESSVRLVVRKILRVVIPITAEVMDDARDSMDKYRCVGAKTRLHAAVCQLVGAEAICSYDRDFDGIKEVNRIEPQAVLS